MRPKGNLEPRVRRTRLLNAFEMRAQSLLSTYQNSFTMISFYIFTLTRVYQNSLSVIKPTLLSAYEL